MSEHEEIKSSTKAKKPKFNWQVIVVIIVLVLALGGWYYWSEVRTTEVESFEATTLDSVEEADEVITSLNIILLPTTDKRPTVGKIGNPAGLQNTSPEFYKDAEIGDYLLFYSNRVVIYRKSENLIVNFAPNFGPVPVAPLDEEQ